MLLGIGVGGSWLNESNNIMWFGDEAEAEEKAGGLGEDLYFIHGCW